MTVTAPTRSDSFVASLRADLPGILAVAATYVYFLLFAQFAFLEILQDRLSTEQVQGAMGAMGVAGLLASLATGRLLGRAASHVVLAAGFMLCAATALTAPFAQGFAALVVLAAGIGAAVALVTVSLATDLRSLVRGPRFGLAVGLGTGLAYAVCNVPMLFEATPGGQAVAVVVACMVGLGAVLWRSADGSSGERTAAHHGLEATRWIFASVVLSFLALVWLDSAAFAVIQESAALKDPTWGASSAKWLLGGVHFVAAVLAGALLDRGAFRGLLVAAFTLFVIAFTTLGPGGAGLVPLALAGPLYAVGISFYSTALVAYPAWRADARGRVPRRWRAAWLFGVAGWLGSALGVGMAQDLHRIPELFLWASGTLLVVAWLVGWAGGGQAGEKRWRRDLGRFVRLHALTFLGLVAALAIHGVGALLPQAGTSVAPESTVDIDALVRRGREVYIAEGCIHCHSQYVRPQGRDADLWGPPGEDALAASGSDGPPLYGNRRQGPDLSNAGLRRSPAWHALHLRAPSKLVPGSRMPSYEHLFAGRRGDALVAYLASLGGERGAAWYELTRAADMGHPESGSAERGDALFGRYCAPCHGAEGRGDGPLGASVRRPAMNLRKGGLWLVSWGPGSAPLEEELARLVKYGAPGTSMPGHEYLTDGQVADLVAYVLELQRAPDAVVADVEDLGAGETAAEVAR